MLALQKTYYFCCQYIPLFFVFGIIIYEYVIFLCLFLVNWFKTSPGLASFVVIEFHVFLILLIISYLRTCFTSPGYVPDNINDFFPNLSELRERTTELKKKQENDRRMEYERRRNFTSNEPPLVTKEKLDSYQAINIGQVDVPQNLIDELTEVTYCFKCEKAKIPRAHHCRNCNRCVLRMDHHCPWTSNCVGLNNHKYFVLFLLYACVSLLNVWACMGSYVYHLLFGRNGADFATIINNLLCVIIAITFFISIAFLFVYNVYSLGKNITTIESNHDRIVNNNPFSKGSFRKNMEEVFGEDILFWLLPTKPRFRDYQNFETSFSLYNPNK